MFPISVTIGHMEHHAYLDPLPAGKTLQVFEDDTCIFSSQGKWLHPLFDFDVFMQSYQGKRTGLYAHDTAIGKAAALLMVRNGIQHIHANLASRLAKSYIDELNKERETETQITLVADTWVDLLLCATEDELAPLMDGDQMYLMLRRRAHLVQGVEVQVRHLASPYGVLKDLSFHLLPGDHLMIVGENGSGKTTLLRMLAGITQAPAGTITIDGKEPDQLARRTIGYIPQSTDSTHFSLTVEEVVSLGVGKRDPKTIDKALRRVGALSLKGRSYNTLSGGEKQKVSLARCLAQKAKLLLFDEPTASLDTASKRMVREILSSLALSEIPTIIVVTHDPELAEMRGWKTLALGDTHD